MELFVDAAGDVRCVYAETIDLSALGPQQIERAGFVEPDRQGQWWADLSPVGGPRLGPFLRRGEGLRAESEWLHIHWPGSRRPAEQPSELRGGA